MGRVSGVLPLEVQNTTAHQKQPRSNAHHTDPLPSPNEQAERADHRHINPITEKHQISDRN